MTPVIKAEGFSLDPKQSELIDTKLKRIAYADDLIVDLLLKVKLDKEFSFEATIHFKWGPQAHVEETDRDFSAGINKLMDTLDYKIKKEKDKIQEK
jgi:putative sigma-54 modulation protein